MFFEKITEGCKPTKPMSYDGIWANIKCNTILRYIIRQAVWDTGVELVLEIEGIVIFAQ